MRSLPETDAGRRPPALELSMFQRTESSSVQEDPYSSSFSALAYSVFHASAFFMCQRAGYDSSSLSQCWCLALATSMRQRSPCAGALDPIRDPSLSAGVFLAPAREEAFQS